MWENFLAVFFFPCMNTGVILRKCIRDQLRCIPTCNEWYSIQFTPNSFSLLKYKWQMPFTADYVYSTNIFIVFVNVNVKPHHVNNPLRIHFNFIWNDELNFDGNNFGATILQRPTISRTKWSIQTIWPV